MMLLRILSYAGWLALGISLAYLYQQAGEVDVLLQERVVTTAGIAGVIALLSLLAQSIARRRRLATEAKLESRFKRGRAAMTRLVDDVDALRRGDLRVRANETDPASAAMAELVNRSVTELRWLVGMVADSSARIDNSVKASRESSARAVEAASAQSRDTHRVSTYIGVMSETMSELSLHAGESGRIALLSVAEAEACLVSIGDVRRHLGRIRDEAVLATRLMQRLADNASAIDERVETIRAVARRTDLLAINTTIRAASNESGDLSRLSDEVTQLAEMLGSSARDIASLSRTIRQDSEDTVSAMQITQNELGAGLAGVEQAGDAIESIETVSRELHTLGREIARKSLRQSGAVRQVSEHLSAIHRVASDNLHDARARAATLDDLQDVRRELSASIAGYRLPPTPVAARESEAPRGRERSGRIIDHV